MTPPIVPWVVGPQLAVARGIALVLCRERGRVWDRLTPAARDALLTEAKAVVAEMVRTGAIASFPHEWREGQAEIRVA